MWHRLKTTGSASLAITAGDLPYFTSSRAVSISATRVPVRAGAALGTPLVIASPRPDTIEEMIVIVNYAMA